MEEGRRDQQPAASIVDNPPYIHPARASRMAYGIWSRTAPRNRIIHRVPPDPRSVQKGDAEKEHGRTAPVLRPKKRGALRFVFYFKWPRRDQQPTLISDKRLFVSPISHVIYISISLSHTRFNSSLSLVDLSRFSRISRRGGLIIKKSELGTQLFKIQKGRPKLNVCSTTWHLAYAPCFKLWK